MMLGHGQLLHYGVICSIHSLALEQPGSSEVDHLALLVQRVHNTVHPQSRESRCRRAADHDADEDVQHSAADDAGIKSGPAPRPGPRDHELHAKIGTARDVRVQGPRTERGPETSGHEATARACSEVLFK